MEEKSQESNQLNLAVLAVVALVAVVSIVALLISATGAPTQGRTLELPVTDGSAAIGQNRVGAAALSCIDICQVKGNAYLWYGMGTIEGIRSFVNDCVDACE